MTASVQVEGSVVGKINRGLAVYVGIENNDEISDLEWGIKKITGLRIFDDKEGKMNLPIDFKNGDLSHQSIYSSRKFKKRISTFFQSGSGSCYCLPYYDKFVEMLGESFAGLIQTGKFGAHMNIALQEDGPVTIWLDSKNKSY